MRDIAMKFYCQPVLRWVSGKLPRYKTLPITQAATFSRTYLQERFLTQS